MFHFVTVAPEKAPVIKSRCFKSGIVETAGYQNLIQVVRPG